ncbi:MAG: carbon-nitrogen hydrolase family protein [Pikeienuella sp.]|uniref:carbon-nitrogen hydrolase family protein n=1 Tax=Pikeienuella sp. TaxID=2831957 RepID=UPI00391D2C71
MILRTALLQLSSSDDPAANLPETEALVRKAAEAGATLVATPEVTNIVSMNRARQRAMLRSEAEDATLARLRAVASELEIWLLIGSLALSGEAPDGRFVNRSFLVTPKGAVAARYDKIHMFDAAPSAGETYRESSGYQPGAEAVLAHTPWGGLGMTICYDMRFPELYLRLARAGAKIVTIPSAFTRPTGAAHWAPLLRARAIETGCFVLAPAQTGRHRAAEGPERETWGRSLVVGPWGEVIADGGEAPGVVMADLDLAAVDAARRRVPSLSGARIFSGP